MKYVQPVGEADPNAPYKDRNTGAGQPGSRVPAKAIENPQREIVTVLTSVGLEPDGDRVDQLNEAIDLKIDLATGGGENPLNDLLDLLRARLKIYPEILTADGRFNLTVPSTGNVRIPSGIQILHRGVALITTAEQTFPTVANKTYHMRYRFTGTPGWSLVDVSDSGYNPSALAETNAAFDTGYDDMISHRVVTDASNVATITALANKDRMKASGEELNANGSLTGYQYEDNVPPSAISKYTAVAINMGRTPDTFLSGVTDVNVDNSAGGNQVAFGVRALSRYDVAVWGQGDVDTWTGWVARA